MFDQEVGDLNVKFLVLIEYETNFWSFYSLYKIREYDKRIFGKYENFFLIRFQKAEKVDPCVCELPIQM